VNRFGDRLNPTDFGGWEVEKKTNIKRKVEGIY